MSVTRIPACNIPIVPDFSCLDKRGMINKVIKLNFQSVHTCITTECMRNDNIFWFIKSWGRHVLKLVKEQLHSWWWPVPFKTPVFVIDRSRVSLPVDFTG